MKRKVTRPRQAGSKSSVNKWQRQVRACLRYAEAWYVPGYAKRLLRELRALDASMAKAQRR